MMLIAYLLKSSSNINSFEEATYSKTMNEKCQFKDFMAELKILKS